jgi:hypothetical protein
MIIDNTYNFDDQFFRMVCVALAKTLSKGIRWINRFEDKKMRVIVPFYLSMAGDERFLFDAFVDDIPDKRVELNTDQIPRGIITLNSISSKADEFANPNQFLSKELKINDEYRKIFSKIKAIPITLNFEIEVRVANTIDVLRVSEKILKVLFNYMFFNIDYFGIKIEAILTLPDDKDITIPREHGLDTDKIKSVKFSLGVDTYYPDFFIDTDDFETCDNDSEINWESMGQLPPSQIGDVPSGKRVYWNSYIWEKNSREPNEVELKSRTNTPKENF